MNNKEIQKKVIENRDYMENLFDVWNGSFMVGLHLTSVGIAIAHANIKKITGEFTDLSIWIN